MIDKASRERANDLQDLEHIIVERQWAGDIDGMVALFEPDAILDTGGGNLMKGTVAIRKLFTDLIVSG